MGTENKIKNKAQEVKGMAKEKVGEHTENSDLAAEGHTDQLKANLKQAGEKVKDAFRK